MHQRQLLALAKTNGVSESTKAQTDGKTSQIVSNYSYSMRFDHDMCGCVTLMVTLRISLIVAKEERKVKELKDVGPGSYQMNLNDKKKSPAHR